MSCKSHKKATSFCNRFIKPGKVKKIFNNKNNVASLLLCNKKYINST